MIKSYHSLNEVFDFLDRLLVLLRFQLLLQLLAFLGLDLVYEAVALFEDLKENQNKRNCGIVAKCFFLA